MVVDLAVVRDDHAAIPVRHGLLAGCEVDDAQTPVAETRDPILGQPDTLLVRPAMDERLAHVDEEVRGEAPARVRDRDEPAHQTGVPSARVEYASITVRAF